MKALLLISLGISFQSFAGEIKNSPALPKAYQRLFDLSEQSTKVGLESYLSKNTKLNLNFQDSDGLTPLMNSVAVGNVDTAKVLLSKNVDIEIKNKNGDTALAMAVSNEQNQIADLLIEAGANLNISCTSEKTTLLMCATMTNNTKVIKLILKKHPNVKNTKNEEGKTAKDLAKDLGTKATQLLLK